MSPIAITQTQVESKPTIHQLKLNAQQVDPGKSRLSGPLSYDGSLDKYSHFDVTPAIGREFSKDLQLKDILHSNDETLMKDLGVLVARRGCCIFRSQEINGEEMLDLAAKLSKATGSPEASAMCIHPVSANYSELGAKTQTISAEAQRKGGGIMRLHDDVSRWSSIAWHSDVSFEKVPADFSMLKITHLPSEGSGGDTQFISTDSLLDKISPSFLAYLETLQVEHNANFFHQEAACHGRTIAKDLVRGNPLNVGDDLSAIHPLIRTNPITGAKALYWQPGFGGRIQGVSKDEHDMLVKFLRDLAISNFECQLRVRWEQDSIALWHNGVTWHSATFDYTSERKGDRASSLGERPYFDPSSKLKSELAKAW